MKTAEELLPALKDELGDEASCVSDDNLLKFLRWKPAVDRAASRFRDHRRWREENPFAFDDTPLQATKDDELKRVLESDVIIAPEDLVSKNGSAVLCGRLRNNDMTDGRTVEDCVRMVLYIMDRVLEREHAQIHGVTLFYDMKGVTSKNLHIGIPKVLVRALVGHFPIRISGAYILNAPFIFKAMFNVIQIMMPAKLRGRFHFVDKLEDVYDVIDKEQLLEEHGGNRLHDSSQWVAVQMQREVSGAVCSLQECFAAE
mmetsp:Transcript_25238/g.51515  ORF Transcript_25238/g.51515 Transcript_25238/m.51515 type:complete len:257 (+) Transcript_25238:143-913(+)